MHAEELVMYVALMLAIVSCIALMLLFVVRRELLFGNPIFVFLRCGGWAYLLA